ncbi:MAG TPA: diacylglycerol kinase family protein [Rhizomicrobium sp.]
MFHSAPAELPDSVTDRTPRSHSRCFCVLNAASGSHAAGTTRDLIEGIFAQRNCDVQIVTAEDGDIAEMVRDAVRAGAKMAVAGGGDGTVNAVVNGLAHTDAALAVLPLGTLNHFAKDLGIPLALEDAVATALEGEVRRVDAGEVNGRLFVNNSSIGLYPQIVRERSALEKHGHGKWPALVRATLAVFRRSKSLRTKLRFASGVLAGRADLVFVGNNEYAFAPPHIGARQRIDKGVLWIYRVPHAGRFRAIAAAIAAFSGGGQPKAPLAFTAAELRIEMRSRSIDVALDGEVLRMNTPLYYRSRAGALRVMVPRQEQHG